jgi:hypothetical protein
MARRMIRRRRKTATVDQVFEEEFALESLKSDRLRVSILIGAIRKRILNSFPSSKNVTH